MKIKPGQRQKLSDVLFAKKTGLGSEAAEISRRAGRGVAMSAAGKGDMDRQVEVMSYLGPAASMALKMQLPVMFKGVARNLGDLAASGKAEEQAAAVEATGMALAEIQKLGEMQRGMISTFKKFKDMSEAQLREEGMTRTGEGKYRRFDKTTGEATGSEIKDWLGLLLASNDVVEHQTKAALTHDQKVAKDISDRTAKLATVMEENIAAILNDIYIVVRDILNFLLGNAKKKRVMDAAGKNLINEIAGDEAAAKVTLSDAKEAHSAAQSTPGADTTATGAAVTAAQGKVDEYGALGAAAVTLDPSGYNTYDDYKDAVYNTAGVKRESARNPQPGGAKKGKASRDRRSKSARGKTFGEAGSEEGWMGVADYIAKMGMTGITTYGDFESSAEEFLQEMTGHMSGADAKLYRDYWREKYIQGFAATSIFGSRNGAMLYKHGLGSQDGWNHASNENADLITDMNEIAEGPEGRDKIMDKYRTFLEGADIRTAEIEPDFNEDSGHRAPTSSRPHIPNAEDMYIPSNGRPLRLNSADEVIAMKPGGAIDRAMGRGGGNITVINNIRWTSDPKVVQKAVVDGINIAKGKPFA